VVQCKVPASQETKSWIEIKLEPPGFEQSDASKEDETGVKLTFIDSFIQTKSCQPRP